MITQLELKQLLNYDPHTGQFTWAITKKGHITKGRKVGSKSSNGYIKIQINNKAYQSHRLAWLYMTGNWPLNDIDHVNGIRIDNRFNNLREATRSENCQNKIQYKKGKLTGAHWHKASQKWLASIRINKHLRHLGLYETEQQAHEAYLKAKAELHTFQPIPRI